MSIYISLNYVSHFYFIHQIIEPSQTIQDKLALENRQIVQVVIRIHHSTIITRFVIVIVVN